MNSSDTNLKPFFDHGGKLLMYHGWADPGIPAGNSVEYYTNVVKGIGGESRTSNSIRLFMLPGVGHCQGGDGPSTFDGSVRWISGETKEGAGFHSCVSQHKRTSSTGRGRFVRIRRLPSTREQGTRTSRRILCASDSFGLSRVLQFLKPSPCRVSNNPSRNRRHVDHGGVAGPDLALFV